MASRFDKDFVIAELGFGTGLNFLLTKKLWQETKSFNHVLNYFSVEKYPLTIDEINQALDKWRDIVNPESMLRQLKGLKSGLNIFHFQEERLILNLFIGDVKEYLVSLPEGVNAWFLDGFSPSSNPEMWCEEVFMTMGLKSAIDSSFATFTSAGFVKRLLGANGFSVKKVKGFGRKRHMLHGKFLNSSKGQ